MEQKNKPKDNKLKNLLNFIKSRNIIKSIFSFLEEDIKLKLTIYNIKLQYIFNIDIDYIKKKSGRIKNIEKNGHGKEYSLNTKKLIFEGKYLNGKRHGKGKEYYENGYLKFKGEYLNGYIKNGKGYNLNGNLILKIEKSGKGKEYYSNGKIQFEGEYLNGRR